MGKSYSVDLRERVVARVDGGYSRRAAAARFSVSVSFAVKLMARRRATGSVAPARQGRPSGGGKLAPHLAFLEAQVETRPDVTMPELAGILEAKRGVRAHPSSLSRVLCAAWFSFKKNHDGIGTRARRCQTAAAGLDRSASTLDAA